MHAAGHTMPLDSHEIHVMWTLYGFFFKVIQFENDDDDEEDGDLMDEEVYVLNFVHSCVLIVTHTYTTAFLLTYLHIYLPGWPPAYLPH